VCNLEIGVQFPDSKNAQHNLEIVQIPKLHGTYTVYHSKLYSGIHEVITIYTCIQWNLFMMDTLGPAISGSFLLLYGGFPLSEVKMY